MGDGKAQLDIGGWWCVHRCWHQDRPHPVSCGQTGGTGAWSCGGAARDLHRVGNLLLPPPAPAWRQDRRGQKRSQGWCLQSTHPHPTHPIHLMHLFCYRSQFKFGTTFSCEMHTSAWLLRHWIQRLNIADVNSPTVTNTQRNSCVELFSHDKLCIFLSTAGSEAGQEWGADGQHRVTVNRGSSAGCQGWFGQDWTHQPRVHRNRGEDCSQPSCGETLEVGVLEEQLHSWLWDITRAHEVFQHLMGPNLKWNEARSLMQNQHTSELIGALMEFMYLVFTCIPGGSNCRQLRSLFLLCLCLTSFQC